MTNSLAPPAVCPRPTKPGLVLFTGVANPSTGVGNSNIVNPELLAGIVSFLAISAVLKSFISLAAVTNTSLAPGDPNVGDAL